jgi:hypothetical protein
VPANPTERLNTMPLAELLLLVLHQFQRLLAERGVDLDDFDLETLAANIVNSEPDVNFKDKVQAALMDIVAESESVLHRWDLTFPQALATGMDAIPGWETTAEFIDLANEKNNAELRIATGSALLVALGQHQYADFLRAIIDHDAETGDREAIIARRILLFIGEK